MTAPSRRARILIVDDETDFRQMLVCLLEQNGFDCVEASDGQAAISLLNNGMYDVGVFDIIMPGMSGWELASIAQAIMPEMRLVAVSAVACSPELTDFGFEAALQKPFKIDSLVRICRSLAGGNGETLAASPPGPH